MHYAKLYIPPEKEGDEGEWEYLDASSLKQRVTNPHDPLTQEDVHDQSNQYQCRYCSAKVWPRAIGETTIRDDTPIQRSPCFYSLEEHDPAICDEGNGPKGSSGVSRPLGNEVTLKGYPNKLTFDWLNPKDRERAASRSLGEVKGARAIVRNWSTDLIAPLVTHFLNPLSKGQDLHIPVIEDVRGYDSIFRQIKFSRPGMLSPLRIYFGQFVYKDYSYNNKAFTLHLTDGRFDQPSLGRYVPKKLSKIIIQIDDTWRQKDIEVLQNDLEKLEREADRARKSTKPGMTKPSPYIFFLGQSKNDENTEFSLKHNNWRLIDLRLITQEDESLFRERYIEIPSSDLPASPGPESTAPSVLVSPEPEVFPAEEPEPKTENSEFIDIPEEDEPQENEDPEISQEHPHEDEESQEGAITGVSQPDSDSDLPVEFPPSSGIPPNDLPQPATETPGVPEGEVSQQDEVADVTHEKSLFKKLQSPLIFLAVLIGLIVVAKNVIVEENIRDSQPTEEVQ
ncbi:hypothetical protein [Acaryochloris sp. CCMEE 5410]|uniref:hypothetical protein n=1 Tax=Acaryochloris sp. CCMEE 5410 TaxID=310037 RepID=UPI0002483A69|nr:hypothetical protein [Acaryochloris sp. CCMEE 5410]KAI9129430.1 hypothetical protein ON05_035565 [Acaryochloris sp. CCMEE 5410]